MKTTKPFIFLLATVLCFCLKNTALAHNSTNANATIETTPSKEEPAAKKAKKKKTNKTNQNNRAVKIYPDIIKREMHVVAKETEGKMVDFFVFGADGTLVQQFKMNEKQHKKLTGLAPGKYIYRVFAGDTEREAGAFEIR